MSTGYTLKDSDIKITNQYIVRKKDKHGKQIEQVVYICDSKEVNGQILYEYDYGIFNTHEGFTNVKNIRNLTEKERLTKNIISELPQQFYHSAPIY